MYDWIVDNFYSSIGKIIILDPTVLERYVRRQNFNNSIPSNSEFVVLTFIPEQPPERAALRNVSSVKVLGATDFLVVTVEM